MVTSADCSRVCAFAFGKMEQGGAFEFSQDIVDGALQTALTIFSGAMQPYNTMLAPWFLRSVVHLCISDANKLLLMQSPLLTRLLVEALLVDPAHPRQEQADAVKAGIQCDAAECFMQLALFDPARDALKQDAEVLDSLRAVVEKGITEEAKKSAEGALMALDPKEGHREIDPDSLHVMMSCARQSCCRSAKPAALDRLRVRSKQTNGTARTSSPKSSGSCRREATKCGSTWSV